MRHFIIIILLAMCTWLFAEESLVARFPQPTQAILATYCNADHDVAAHRPGEYLDVVMPRSEYDALLAAGYNVTVHITEQQMRDNLTPDAGRPIPGYHDYDETLAILQQCVADYPDLCALFDIGDSWGPFYSAQGHTYYDPFDDHELWALKVSANVAVDEDEPHIFFIGEHHAREPISAEVVLGLLEHMLDNYGTDPEITDDIDSKTLWFIPLLNPDGHKIVLDQTDIWWRKNIRDNNDNHTFDSDYGTGTGDDGVDLNRNYGFMWGNVGSTDNPNGVTYHGPEAFSEPESQAIRDLVSAHHFVLGFTYHSYSELVLYPYAYAEDIYTPDVVALSGLAMEVAAAIDALYGGHYTGGPSYGLYPTMGDTTDWAYGLFGIFAYTIELATQFIPPQSQIGTITDDNIPGAMLMLDRIDYATLTGHIIDADTGPPVQAEVFVEGIDDTGEFRHPMLADETWGRYWRMLPPGDWTVEYRAYGYASQSFDVTITDDARTIQDVALTPVGTTTFTGTVYDAVTGNGLADATVTMLGTPFDPVTTPADGSFSFVSIAYGSYELEVTREGYGMWRDWVEVTPGGSVQIPLFPPAFADDFESGLDNWTTTGSWNTTTNESHSPSHSLTDSPTGNYGNNSNTSATLAQDIDLTTAENASVSFWAKWDIESGYDYCYLQARQVGQTQWTSLGSLSGENDWAQQQFSLNQFCGQQIQLRFRFETDTYVTDDGIYIDDFTIYMDYPLDLTNGDVDAFTRLRGNYPNPFNPETRVAFDLAHPGAVNLRVFNTRGQLVATLVNTDLPAGTHSVVWDGQNSHGAPVASGIYLFRLETDNATMVRKGLLLK
ncbi:MAG: carboxypeptidase regulatory-like domain-containing protein [Candidatus Cloacimonetes bacterium]|nr:carboxypeptidase regulatory-like domain-containing protein [Candidatus Cloacimonadota bacterium]